ncbi:MAG: hypothetical protein WCJ61_12455 [Paludibacter sp.]
MIRFLLSLFRPFRWFIERTGADYNQFIHILELKLTMDNRRAPKNSGNKSTTPDNSILKQSFGQIVIGFMFAMMGLIIKSEFTYFYLMHSILMFMMAMLIISEFTTVLFDTSENTIIQPLPIKGSTQSLARNAHVFLYLALIAFNISVASIIIATIKFGILSGLIFIVSILFNVLFTLFLANMLYLGIMHIVSGEQLKNVMMYFQIVIAILFMAGYQFGINLIDKSQIMNMTIGVSWYTFLIPPAFFSGLIEALSKGLFDLNHFIFIAEALTIPIVATFITTRYLTPVFNRKLLNLEQADRATKVKTSSGKTSFYFNIVSKLFVRQNEERAAFQLAWRMSGYERLFKQSFFPSLAYVLIMVAVQFFKKDVNLSEIASSSRYLILLYSFILVSLTLSSSLILGNNNQIDWIYKILPVNSPADYFKGFIKAVFARFFIPFYVLLSIGIVAFWGIRVIPDIIVAWLVIYMSTLLVFYMQQPVFPFSQAKNSSQGGKNFAKIMGLIISAFLFGGLHYFVGKWSIYGIIALMVLYSTAIILINKKLVYKLINWGKIDDFNTYN